MGANMRNGVLWLVGCALLSGSILGGSWMVARSNSTEFVRVTDGLVIYWNKETKKVALCVPKVQSPKSYLQCTDLEEPWLAENLF